MKCIVCGNATGRVRYYGSLNGMTVSFCSKHASDCMNLEECKCEITLKRNSENS